MNKIILIFAMITISACNMNETDSRIAGRNLNTAAEMFEINRRIVFYNGITGDYMLSIEGKCDISDESTKVKITCKTGPDTFKRHQLGLSDNITYMSEHLNPTSASVYHNRVVFKPQSIIPEVDINVDVNELKNNRH